MKHFRTLTRLLIRGLILPVLSFFVFAAWLAVTVIADACKREE